MTKSYLSTRLVVLLILFSACGCGGQGDGHKKQAKAHGGQSNQAPHSNKIQEAKSNDQKSIGHTSWVNSVAFSPDGKRIVTGSDDTTVKVWDAGNAREILTLRHTGANVYSVAFSPDGKRIASGGWDSTVKVWDAHNGANLLTFRGHTKVRWSRALGHAIGRVNAVAFSPDGNFVLSGGSDHTVKVVDLSSGKSVFSAVSNLAGNVGDDVAVCSVAFSPDGRRFASGNADRTVKIWTIDPTIPVQGNSWNAQKVLTLRGHQDLDALRIRLGRAFGDVQSVAFSPDGKRLVSGSSDRTVKVWDAYTGKDLLTLRGHTTYVTSVAFSPDGRRIVSGSYDRTVKVWDAHTGQELMTLRGHTGTVYSVAFSPDGKRIVSGGGIVADPPKAEVKVWNAATGQPLFSLPAETDPNPEVETPRTLDVNPEVDNVVRRFNEIPTSREDIAYASPFDVPSTNRDHIQGVGRIGNRYVLSHSHTPIPTIGSQPYLMFIADSSGNGSDWRASFKARLDPAVQEKAQSGHAETHYLGHAGAIQCIGDCIAVPFEAPNRNKSAYVNIYRVVNWKRQTVSRIQQIRVDPACVGSHRSAAAVGITHDGSKYIMAVFNYDNSDVYIAYSEPNKPLDECKFTWVTKHTMPNNYQGGLSLVTEAGNSKIKQVWALGFYNKEDGGEWGSYVDLLRFNSQSQSFREVAQGTKKLQALRGRIRPDDLDWGPTCRWGASCTPESNRLVVTITCRGFHLRPTPGTDQDDNRIRLLRCEAPSP